jgi:hypothetical protein
VCGDKCMKFCYIVALVYIVVGTQNHHDHHYYQQFFILPVLGKSLNNDSLTPGARIVLSAPPHLAIYPGYSSRCDSQKKLFPSFSRFSRFRSWQPDSAYSWSSWVQSVFIVLPYHCIAEFVLLSRSCRSTSPLCRIVESLSSLSLHIVRITRIIAFT